MKLYFNFYRITPGEIHRNSSDATSAQHYLPFDGHLFSCIYVLSQYHGSVRAVSELIQSRVPVHVAAGQLLSFLREHAQGMTIGGRRRKYYCAHETTRRTIQDASAAVYGWRVLPNGSRRESHRTRLRFMTCARVVIIIVVVAALITLRGRY